MTSSVWTSTCTGVRTGMWISFAVTARVPGIPHLPPELMADHADRQLRLVVAARCAAAASCRGSGRCPRTRRAPTSTTIGTAMPSASTTTSAARSPSRTPGNAGRLLRNQAATRISTTMPNAERGADRACSTRASDAARRAGCAGRARSACEPQPATRSASDGGTQARAAATCLPTGPRSQVRQRLPAPSALKRDRRRMLQTASPCSPPLSTRGRRAPPPARQAASSWRAAVRSRRVAALLSSASPLDRSRAAFAAHMVQHLLIGDLAPLLVVLGLDGPLLRPGARAAAGARAPRARTPARRAAALGGQPLRVAPDAALRRGARPRGRARAAALLFFVLRGALWAALVEPLPGPAWFTAARKLAYVARDVARLARALAGVPLVGARVLHALRRRAAQWG